MFQVHFTIQNKYLKSTDKEVTSIKIIGTIVETNVSNELTNEKHCSRTGTSVRFSSLTFHH